MYVLIKGKDLIPIARFLEALTTAGLLDSKATWEEGGDWIRLHLPFDATMRRVFERKGFPVFVD